LSAAPVPAGLPGGAWLHAVNATAPAATSAANVRAPFPIMDSARTAVRLCGTRISAKLSIAGYRAAR
jgi:hypothetical protein